ncbi:MAG: MBL fold metallo-hydrolase [Chloroflexi bacterium]|nr:MBL fold metallo-hydrolase [Chloroflexota bacterium]
MIFYKSETPVWANNDASDHRQRRLLSTNYWVVSAGRSRLLFDIGWPGTMGMMLANLKRMDVPLAEICYALASHYHIDHAGLAQDFKQSGAPLLVMETQVAAIPLMKQWAKPQDRYTEITLDGNVTIQFTESRALLEQIGIAGEILSTPGHSPDSVSLLLDEGAAFTGDLPKQHYKFFFHSVIQDKESHILLDILFEANPYPRLQEIELESPLLATAGKATKVTCPTVEGLLGDKLTAFVMAIRSTG